MYYISISRLTRCSRAFLALGVPECVWSFAHKNKLIRDAPSFPAPKQSYTEYQPGQSICTKILSVSWKWSYDSEAPPQKILRIAYTQPKIEPLHDGFQTLLLDPLLIRLFHVASQREAMLNPRKQLQMISFPVLFHPVDGKPPRLRVESMINLGA
jgi:hypothetical protein